jgi:RNA polymerase sigma-70 factor (ECF subfamily)
MIQRMRIAPTMPPTSDESDVVRLVEQAAAGNDQAWAELLARHRGRLRRMVEVRMDRRLQGRVDASDIIQEACLVASKQLPEYAASPSLPFYLWLRWIAARRLIDQQRRHLASQVRGVNREVVLYQGPFPEARSDQLSARLEGCLPTPSQEAIRSEQSIALQEALNALEPIDREILALRHFEQLSNGQAASILGIDKSAASKRYGRALRHLKNVLLPLLGSDV